LYRRGWINDGEPPMAGIHGTADGTVPFLTGVAANIAYLEGTGVLHPHALATGVWTYLKKVPGGGHGNIYDQPQYAAQLDNYWMRATALLEHLTCFVDTLPQIATPVVEQSAGPGIEWAIFPNPVQHDNGTVRLPVFEGNATLVFHDLNGREVLRVGNIRQGEQEVSLAGLAPGVYSISLVVLGNVVGSYKLVRL